MFVPLSAPLLLLFIYLPMNLLYFIDSISCRTAVTKGNNVYILKLSCSSSKGNSMEL